MDDKPTHFKGKDALGHVAEAQIQGLLSSTEIHGAEIPGHIQAASDAARDTSIAVGLIGLILFSLELPFSLIFLLLAIFGGGWALWKAGRSAWLGWSRLERLHRVIAQEKWEIEHHRPQEREELRALYGAKGFEGKLLEDVVDVLMSDSDRLLRVMVEEEMGYSLETHEHPLQHALGAAIGSILALAICGFLLFFLPPWGLIVGSFVVMAGSAALASYQIKNQIIPAVIWNIGLGAIAMGFVYFVMQFFFSIG